jgi:hypothetical protein
MGSIELMEMSQGIKRQTQLSIPNREATMKPLTCLAAVPSDLFIANPYSCPP